MKQVKYFLSDNKIPTDEELQECLNIKKTTSDVICLKWFVPYNGWHALWFTEASLNWTVQDCKNNMPNSYGI